MLPRVSVNLEGKEGGGGGGLLGNIRWVLAAKFFKACFFAKETNEELIPICETEN